MSNRSSLPKTNSNEDLETISRLKFSLLLNTALFEIRQESVRDKGVDLIIEIKKNGRYLNFRFAVQLKATYSSKVKGDGSMAYGLELSNINYLLNNGMPAYYVLYNHKTNDFYVAHVGEVWEAIWIKYQNKSLPTKFSYSFSRKVDKDAIAGMHRETLDTGKLFSRLSTQRRPGVTDAFGGGILIDEDSEVYTTDQNIAFIEHRGFDLLNARNSQQIIEVEQRTYLGGKEASPMFNYICGMAYFQKGEMFRAVDYLKRASRNADLFAPDQRSILTHVLLQAKHLLGMISKEVYQEQRKVLLAGKDIGSFLEVDKACQEFYTSKRPWTKGIETLYGTISNILSAYPHALGTRMMVFAKILNIELVVLTTEFSDNLATLFCLGVGHLKDELYQVWTELEEKYFARLQLVYEQASKTGDVPVLSGMTLDHLKWVYKTTYIKQFFDNWNAETMKSVGPGDALAVAKLISKSGILDEVYKYSGDTANAGIQAVFLCLKYEIEDYTGQDWLALETLNRIKFLIEDKGLEHSNGPDYQELVQGRTDHRVFYAKMKMKLIQFYSIAANSKIDRLNVSPAKSLAEVEGIVWSIPKLMEFEFPDINQAR